MPPRLPKTPDQKQSDETVAVIKKKKGNPNKAKGTRGEVQFVDFLKHGGVPAMRVTGSGAFRGAKADVKVGVHLEEDGSYPDSDEAKCVLRAEVKYHASLNDKIWTERDEVVAIMKESTRHGHDTIFGFMNQETITKATVLRRNKIPKGALEGYDGNQVFAVVMGLDDWIALFKKAYPDVVIVE